MRIYVAGPMSGLPEFNYPAFYTAAAALRRKGHDVLNPADVDRLDTGTPRGQRTWHWYMRRTLRMVLEADAIALLPGWENSRGATLEHKVAEALGLNIATLDEWLRKDVA